MLAGEFIPWFSRHWDDGQCAVSLLCYSKTLSEESMEALLQDGDDLLDQRVLGEPFY